MGRIILDAIVITFLIVANLVVWSILISGMTNEVRQEFKNGVKKKSKLLLERRGKRWFRVCVLWQSESQPFALVRKDRTRFLFAGRLYVSYYPRVRAQYV